MTSAACRAPISTTTDPPGRRCEGACAKSRSYIEAADQRLDGFGTHVERELLDLVGLDVRGLLTTRSKVRGGSAEPGSLEP